MFKYPWWTFPVLMTIASMLSPFPFSSTLPDSFLTELSSCFSLQLNSYHHLSLHPSLALSPPLLSPLISNILSIYTLWTPIMSTSRLRPIAFTLHLLLVATLGQGSGSFPRPSLLHTVSIATVCNGSQGQLETIRNKMLPWRSTEFHSFVLYIKIS